MGNLTNKKLESYIRSKSSKMYLDSDGLYFDNKNRRSRWVYKYKRSGAKNHTEVPLGKYPDVSLANARNKARLCRNQRFDGKDPHDEYKTRIAVQKIKAEENRNYSTLMDIAEEWFDVQIRTGRWKTNKKKADCRNNFLKYVVPKIKNKNIKDITTNDIIRILEQKHTNPATGMEGMFYHIQYPTAKKTKEWLQAFFRFADAEYLVDKDGNSITDRYPSLHYTIIKPFLKKLEAVDTDQARLLEWKILTAERTEAVCQTKWKDIDLKKGIWTVPTLETKGKKSTDTVALSTQAISLLEYQKKVHNGNSPYVFTNTEPLKEYLITILRIKFLGVMTGQTLST